MEIVSFQQTPLFVIDLASLEVGNIIERLQQIDVWGPISRWTAATLERLGDLFIRILGHCLSPLPGPHRIQAQSINDGCRRIQKGCVPGRWGLVTKLFA